MLGKKTLKSSTPVVGPSPHAHQAMSLRRTDKFFYGNTYTISYATDNLYSLSSVYSSPTVFVTYDTGKWEKPQESTFQYSSFKLHSNELDLHF